MTLSTEKGVGGALLPYRILLRALYWIYLAAILSEDCQP
jgi:hypothetical protein